MKLLWQLRDDFLEGHEEGKDKKEATSKTKVFLWYVEDRNSTRSTTVKKVTSRQNKGDQS